MHIGDREQKKFYYDLNLSLSIIFAKKKIAIKKIYKIFNHEVQKIEEKNKQ